MNFLLLLIIINIFEGSELNKSVFHSVLNIVRFEGSNVNIYMFLLETTRNVSTGPDLQNEM